MNSLYLRLKSKLYLEAGSGGVSAAQVASALKETEALGFVFSGALLDRLHTLSANELKQFLKGLLKDLSKLTGAHRSHRPLFPGFPAQVMLASQAELYLAAVRHYMTQKCLPTGPDERPPLLNGRVPQEIGLGSVEDFESLFPRLVSARTSLSQQEKDDLAWFVRTYRQGIFRLLPDEVPFKENLAVVCAQLWIHVNGQAMLDFLQAHLKTATDVLRFTAALNGGDVSLALPTRFKSMRRAQRRMLLDLLERCADPSADMMRRPERWKRLGEVLHPGDFAGRFPAAWAAFATLRSGLPFFSFNGAVERHLAEGQAGSAAQLLVARPGELTRRLDHLLRSPGEPAGIAAAFSQVAGQVSTPLLLQALSHFQRRGDPPALRIFFPKGNDARLYGMPDQRAPLPAGAAASVVQTCEHVLMARFARLPPLGRCYVDPALADYLVPLAQRSSSRALRTLVRGSRLPLPDTRIIRLFLWWMNGSARTDIDLSAVFYNDHFDYLDVVSYHRLKSYGAYHSGDIIDAPMGAAEFIDLDLEQLREKNIRFVAVSVNSFTEQPYCELPECFTGWMARSDANSGEVFEPRTVENRIDLASDTAICLPYVLDLAERRIVWVDLGLKGRIGWNNALTNLSGVSLMLRAMTDLVKPDLFSLFSLHARARGELVNGPEQADAVFSVKRGVTPFDLDVIRADFL